MLANNAKVVACLLRREQSGDDAACHRQQRVAETGAGVAGMDQQLGPLTAGLEQGIARHGIVADQKAIEIPAHLGGDMGQRSRFVGFFHTTQDLGVATDLLEQQRHRPAAHHPVAHARVDRLQRVVPVALPVADEMGAGDEALDHRRQQPLDVLGNRVAAWRELECIVHAPWYELVQKARVVGGFDIVVERLERPDDDVAVTVPVLDERVGLEHEPLRPVSARLVLLRENDAQDLFHRLVVLQREQELYRTLADVTGAPGSTGKLLEAVRHRQMNDRVVREPRERRIERSRVGSTAGYPQTARDIVPIAHGRREKARLVDSTLVLGCKAICRIRIRQRPDHGKTELRCGQRPDRDIGPAPELPIRVEQLVSAERFDDRGRAGDQMVDRCRVALSPRPVGVGPEGEALGSAV